MKQWDTMFRAVYRQLSVDYINLSICVRACVFVNSRWHGVPACYSRHSSGPGGNTGSVSRDNTRPKQSGTASLSLRVTVMKWGGVEALKGANMTHRKP